MPKEAKQIVQTLKDAGYIAYYAGGWVRDYLLNHPSDDIDIATSAPPQVVQELFDKTIPVGIQFGIIIVQVDKKQYEVATFRKDIEYKDGRRPSRVEFTEAVEDAKRRDFTINGMFFDPIEEKVYDYVEGQKDLEKKIIRAIGNAHERINEDRLRMIRAVRMAVRFEFEIEEKTILAIKAHANELFPAVAIERVMQEFQKMRSIETCILMMHDYKLLQTIFPTTKNLSIKDLKTRIHPVGYYPANAPLISKILCLFLDPTEKQVIDLCLKLKLSKEERDFAIFLIKAKNILSHEATDYDLVTLYANSSWDIVLQILSAHKQNSSQEQFYTSHIQMKQELIFWVDRKIYSDPLITSSILQEHGISPGKKMGLLLKQAEKTAIEQKLKDPNDILALLKKDDTWLNLE